MNAELLERTPLLTAEGARLHERLREHPDAPRWNYAVGDRLVREDLPVLDHFREQLATQRGARDSNPPPAVVQMIAGWRDRVPWFRRHIPGDLDLAGDWGALPTAARVDLATASWEFVPDDVALDRLVIYRTAGTTGHPIEVPHHPRAIACYMPLIEHALRAHGAALEPDPNRAACFLVSAQVKTYTYSTVLSAWSGAGFAKVNLRATEWPREESARRYFAEFAPPLITGEPVAFAELLEMGIGVKPAALLSTSLAMPPALLEHLRSAFGCPVIDWYSLVETGPVAYSCPRAEGFHLLPHDLHVEILRADGTPAATGERGEITLSGGRNPFLPLLRYRTGDLGRIEHRPCACGDPMPRLLELEGRVPVLFRAADGTPVGAVDLSRLLREFPLLQHSFTQQADGACTLVARPLPSHPAPAPAEIAAALHQLMGALPIEVRLDPTLGENDAGKIVPYRSALSLGGS